MSFLKYSNYLTHQKPYALVEVQAKVEQLRASGKEVIDFTLGDPDDETCPQVRDGIVQFVHKNKDSSYPKTPGTPEFRAAVCDWATREYGIALDPDKHVLSCNGTKEAICSLALAFDWSDKKEIFFPGLSYPVYKNSAQLLDVNFRELPIDASTGFLPDLDALSAADWNKCRIFWLNSPHNPTSVIASEEYCQALVAKAEEYGFLIASDEAYAAIYFKDRPFSFLETSSEHWIVFSSLSKRNNMTGYRTGAMLTLNEELRNMLVKMRMPMGMAMSEVIAAGATEAWRDTEHAAENRETFKKKAQVIRTALEKVGCEIVGGDATFYFWFSHPNYNSSEKLWEKFLEQGLVLTPGTAFGDSGEGYVRLAFARSLDICEKVAAKISNVTL